MIWDIEPVTTGEIEARTILQRLVCAKPADMVSILIDAAVYLHGLPTETTPDQSRDVLRRTLQWHLSVLRWHDADASPGDDPSMTEATRLDMVLLNLKSSGADGGE